MFGLNQYLYLFILSIVAVIVLFIIAKLLGKKQIAQLDFIDYVIGISIGSIAAEMATDTTDTPIWFYLIAMAIFFIFDIAITLLGRTFPSFKHFFKGKPMTIIYDGQIDYKVLKKSKLDVNDVISLCREQGYFDLSKIAFAIFETSGKLSVMPVGEQTPTVLKDIDAPIEKPALPFYMVVDGRISYSSLNELGKDIDWLYSELGIETDDQLKEIILAIYDDKNQQMLVTNKNDCPSDNM